jgi:type II secretory pathway predicted ATPase ExeA
MYRKYFGLTKLPFKSTPDINVFYKHGSRQEILEALLYTISRGDGIVKVTGEVGCGKTMLLRLLATSLPRNFSIVYINSPNLSAKDMILYICSELHLDVDSSMLKFTLLNTLKTELVRLHSEGKQVVMLIDEAQSMTLDVLEEIRLLSNLETSDDKLIQIVLFGQPELDVALERDSIRQLKSRISFNIYIPPLTPSEVKAYLNYRMRKSSYEGLDLFDINVSKRIHKLTDGLPRAVNIMADKLLMSAYGSGDAIIKNKHIKLVPDFRKFSSVREIFSKKIVILIFSFSLLLISMFYVLSSGSISTAFNVLTQSNQENEASKVSSKQNTISKPNELIVKEPASVFESSLLDSENNSVPLDALTITQPVEATALALISLPDFEFVANDMNALVDNPQKLSLLLKMHTESYAWIQRVPSHGYVIQLATSTLGEVNSILAFYKRSEMPIDSLHILIDFNQKIGKFRLKVFYVASESYSKLIRSLSELPPKFTKSKPYITTVKQVTSNMKFTSLKLKQHGISNVSK